MAITNKARDKAYMTLYRAVCQYVRAQGGQVFICDGIQVQEWPGEPKRKLSLSSFSIAVKCLGRKPTFAAEQERSQRWQIAAYKEAECG